VTQPYGLANKRWAQRANAIQFGELAAVRATAAQWRNGLAGLTALLSAGTLLASPTLASHLDPGPQLAVGLLAVAGLLAVTRPCAGKLFKRQAAKNPRSLSPHRCFATPELLISRALLVKSRSSFPLVWSPR